MDDKNDIDGIYNLKELYKRGQFVVVSVSSVEKKEVGHDGNYFSFD